MKHVIELQGVRVEKGSCTVGFRVWTSFGDRDLTNEGVEITHGMMYAMLTQAVKVIDRQYDTSLVHNGRIAQLEMGNNITVDVWAVVR